MRNYSTTSNENLIRLYNSLDMDTTTQTVADELRRMSTICDIGDELRRRGYVIDRRSGKWAREPTRTDPPVYDESRDF